MLFPSQNFLQSGCLSITDKREAHWNASDAKYNESQ